jgi:hypothetical protein
MRSNGRGAIERDEWINRSQINLPQIIKTAVPFKRISWDKNSASIYIFYKFQFINLSYLFNKYKFHNISHPRIVLR